MQNVGAAAWADELTPAEAPMLRLGNQPLPHAPGLVRPVNASTAMTATPMANGSWMWRMPSTAWAAAVKLRHGRHGWNGAGANGSVVDQVGRRRRVEEIVCDLQSLGQRDDPQCVVAGGGGGPEHIRLDRHHCGAELDKPSGGRSPDRPR